MGTLWKRIGHTLPQEVSPHRKAGLLGESARALHNRNLPRRTACPASATPAVFPPINSVVPGCRPGFQPETLLAEDLFKI